MKYQDKDGVVIEATQCFGTSVLSIAPCVEGHASYGDWIVTLPTGWPAVVTDDIFKASFTPVETSE